MAGDRVSRPLPKTGPDVDYATGLLAAGAFIATGKALDRAGKRREAKTEEAAWEESEGPNPT